MYRLVKEEGPAHHRLFTSEVILEQQAIAHGQGKTKKNQNKKQLNAHIILCDNINNGISTMFKISC